MMSINLIISAVLSTTFALLIQTSGGVKSMKAGSPFSLTIRKSDGLAVEARLKNISDKAQIYLYHIDLQPSEPVIRKGAGKPLVPFDERTVKKFNPTVYRAMYRTLNPGEEVTLGKTTFDRDGDGTYSFRWTPFLVRKLPAGKYSLFLKWKCAENSWEDSETQAFGQLDDLWLGSLKSNSITISLPKAK